MSKKKKAILIISGLLALTIGITVFSVLAVHDLDLFELDENAVDDLGVTGDDWDTLYKALPGVGGSALRFAFVEDPVEDTEDDIFAKNSKDTIDIADWWWKLGEPNDKNDIEHAYVAAYNNPANDHLILYFGIDKLDNSGDAALGVWFVQQEVTQEGDGEKNSPFGGGHAEGDILVQSDFTNGGDIERLDVYTWGGTVGDVVSPGSPLRRLFSAQDCDDAVPDDTACAQVNTEAVPAPWDYWYKPPGGVVPSEVFPTATFFEGGIDITALVGRTPCVTGFVAETRQSQSETAVLEDKAIGAFDLCSILVEKSGPLKSKVGDDAAYTATITNTGAVTLYKQSILDSLAGDLTDGPNPDIVNSDCGASLTPNASCSITYVYTVQTGDPDLLLNTVSVVYDNQDDLLGDEVSGSANWSVNLFQPDYSITKDGDTLSKIGDEVTYTFTIENKSSPDSPDLNLVSIADDKLGDLLSEANAADCDVLTSDPSETCTFDVIHTIPETADDPYNNVVTVMYQVDGFPNQPVRADTHSVNLFQPSVDVQKTGDTLSKVGDEVTYTFTITNTSSWDTPKLMLDLTNGVVDDVLGNLTADAVADDCGELLPETSEGAGDEESCTFTKGYTVQEGDDDPLVNRVDVLYQPEGFTNPITDFDTHSVNLFQPDISVTKECTDLSKIGDPVDCTVTITNDSSDDSPDLVFDSISDTVQGDLTDAANYTSSTCGASFAWDESCTIIYSYNVPGDATDPYPNTVTVETHPSGFTNDIDAQASDSVDLFNPAIAIAKTGDLLSKIGDEVDYTITLSNNSSADSPALNCIATDSLLGVVFNGVLPLGDTVLDLSRTVQAGDPDPLVNNVSMTCSVAGFPNILGPVNDSHTTELFQPAVEVIKSGPSTAVPGETITYNFTINNLSSADSPSLILDSVTDTVIGNLTATASANGCGSLVSGGSCNFTAPYTIKSTDASPLVNVVTVLYHPDGFPNVITDSDDHQVLIPNQGCTPGFWQGGAGKKLWNSANDSQWNLSGGTGTNPYIHTTLFNDFFTAYSETTGLMMFDLVSTGGGSNDWRKAARDVVAAYLNASWGMAFPYTPQEIKDMWTAAVGSGDFAGLHNLLAPANNPPNGYCPAG